MDLQKEADKETHNFISSTDILASWSMRAFNAAFAVMVVNFRDCIPGIVARLAGNYEHILCYTKEVSKCSILRMMWRLQE
jgi:hypothetical protein